MVQAWVKDEMETADLKDKRLDKRLIEVLDQLGNQPSAGIPAACGGHAEMTAAYRFFGNEKATWAGILEPHAEATRRRMADQAVVVLAQDTTEMDVTRPAQQVSGAGPLDGGARWGALVHPLHAFTPDGTPLGTLYSQVWVRDHEVRCASLTRAERAATPFEEKESYRWLLALRRGRAEADRIPQTRFVCVADSEADIYEYVSNPCVAPGRLDLIVRACQDRVVQGAEEGQRLRETVLAHPVLFTHEIKVRGRTTKVACETRGRRQARQTRTAAVAVRAAQVTLRPPWRPGGHLPAVTLNAVLVREVDPPEGEEPVEWLLLTTLPIDDVEAVRQIIQFYCTRWMIEVLFRVLKSGCRVEQRRLETMDRFEACLAVYLIVAWRTLYVCRLGRSCPDISCEAIFEPAEWKSVWQVVRRTPPPSTPPSLGDMVRLVAQLGGYVYSKSAAPPGPQAIWIGLQRTHDLALCWNTFGPEARSLP
jgi:hypothetical protein